jgi:hypothetical protein
VRRIVGVGAALQTQNAPEQVHVACDLPQMLYLGAL